MKYQARPKVVLEMVSSKNPPVENNSFFAKSMFHIRGWYSRSKPPKPPRKFVVCF